MGGDLDRLAVVHFRYASGNAGLAIPPENMLPALAFLRDSGSTIVKLGTEPYPAEFARLGVVNYSENPLRSFKNDLALLCNAKIALINASGLENIVDIMEIPTVSYARWHLIFGPYSSRAVVLPALLLDPVRQRLMTFGEQMLFFKTLCEYWARELFSWHIPRDRFFLRSPRADELLAAVQEAEGLRAPRELSPRQLRFNQLDANGPLSVVKSRVSDFFLERFQELL